MIQDSTFVRAFSQRASQINFQNFGTLRGHRKSSSRVPSDQPITCLVYRVGASATADVS